LIIEVTLTPVKRIMQSMDWLMRDSRTLYLLCGRLYGIAVQTFLELEIQVPDDIAVLDSITFDLARYTRPG
jgi:hypothetical protein